MVLHFWPGSTDCHVGISFRSFLLVLVVVFFFLLPALGINMSHLMSVCPVSVGIVPAFIVLVVLHQPQQSVVYVNGVEKRDKFWHFSS